MFVKDAKTDEYIWLNQDQVESFVKLGPGLFNVVMGSGREHRVKFFGDMVAFHQHMAFPAGNEPPQSDREVIRGDQPIPNDKAW